MTRVCSEANTTINAISSGCKMSSTRTVTIQCSEHNHPDFKLVVDEAIPQVDVNILGAFLEQSVQGGVRYEDGQTIEYGSMLFRVLQLGDCLILHEPDLRTIPIAWIEGVTHSMKLLRLQKDIGESVGLGDELAFPSIRCSLLVGTDWRGGHDPFVLERSEPDGLDSGWFVGRLDTAIDYNDPAHLQRISVYQAILNVPQIAGFLALPTGCRVEISPQSTTIAYNGQPLTIQKGSFMDPTFPDRI
jgi:hypothetical protein